MHASFVGEGQTEETHSEKGEMSDWRGSSSAAVTTTLNFLTDLNRGCREATPSPTIDESGKSSSEVPDEQCPMSTDTDKRKRHWCEIA
jgi:hypothetical protein